MFTRTSVYGILIATTSALLAYAIGCNSGRDVTFSEAQDAITATAAVDDPPPPLEWPRVFQDGAITFSVYQPQIDRWDGLVLASRAAVAVTSDGHETYGVIDITGTTDVDKEAGTVTLRNLQIVKASFPSAADREMAYLALLRGHVPAVRVLSLEHFEASYAASQTLRSARTVEVSNAVPRIIFSATPALLVMVDGPAVLRPVPASAVMYVFNTRALILKVNDKFYLAAVDRWYEAPDIKGPWTVSSSPPTALLAQAKLNLLNAKQPLDLLKPPADATTPLAPPAVFVSTTPTELIQTQGKPEYEPIAGTKLLHIRNSDNAVFLNIASNEFFVLISGRWFKGPSLERGPWFYVPGRQLPADFALIPPDHSRANVLVSVPETPQAQEAVIANSIPQTAAVERTQTANDIAYDGPPKFVSVTPVPTLEYAVNTTTPVIHVIGRGYYCVQNGVWFWSNAAYGPWAVADVVPPEIYTIPPSCPLHYVTYVRVYDATPTTIYVGYTPGYLGTVVSPDCVVVYGTGYYYQPYIGGIWVGCPWSYGYGAGFADGYDIGFSFGFSAGFRIGVWSEPWWGPFGWGWGGYGHRYHHHSLNHLNLYGHWPGHGVTSHGGYAGYGNRPGPHERFNPYGGYRPTGLPGRQSHSQLPSAQAAPRSNVYAGHGGEVYRHNGAEWQLRTPQGWSSAERDRVFRSQRDQLERAQQSRIRGEQRYQSNRPAAPPSHPGGAPAHGSSRR